MPEPMLFRKRAAIGQSSDLSALFRPADHQSYPAGEVIRPKRQTKEADYPLPLPAMNQHTNRFSMGNKARPNFVQRRADVLYLLYGTADVIQQFHLNSDKQILKIRGNAS